MCKSRLKQISLTKITHAMQIHNTSHSCRAAEGSLEVLLHDC